MDSKRENFFNPWRKETPEVKAGVGAVVEKPEDLMKAAEYKQSIAHPNWGVKPAAWVAQMNFSIIMRAIRDRQLRLYTPKKRRR